MLIFRALQASVLHFNLLKQDNLLEIYEMNAEFPVGTICRITPKCNYIYENKSLTFLCNLVAVQDTTSAEKWRQSLLI